MSRRAAVWCLIAAMTAGVAATLRAAPVGSPVPKLTSRQRAERLRELPPDERTWLTVYVAPIILPVERDLFLLLPADYQREMFRREFWARREQSGLLPPLGPGYETRYANLREIAAGQYDGIESDAGRLVVRLGEPVDIEEIPGCSEVYRQLEIWTYPSAASRREVRHIFYRPSFGGPRRLWVYGDRELFQTASCLVSFDQACARTANQDPPRLGDAFCPKGKVPQTCLSACYLARLASDVQSRASFERSSLFEPPSISTEGLEGLWRRLALVSDPTAKTISLAPSAAAPVRTAPEPADAPSDWSNERIREAILGLSKKHREWLELAAPLLSREELVVFLRLPPGERDAYVRRFWKKHGHVR
ncbi:MAG: hypothetical protein ABI682_09740 [Acidobacteriota bacterium]